MKKFIILIFFTLIIKAQAENKIIYGGFSYGSILPENTFTKYVHDRSNGQSEIDKLLFEASKKINNNSFKLSYELLNDGLSEKDQNVLVLALDDESIDFIAIEGDNLTRTDIILSFQVIFFNAKNNSLNASIPIEVSKVLNSSKPLSKNKIISELKNMYENEVMEYFLQLVNNFELKNKYNNRIGITKVIFEENAENFINQNTQKNDIFKKNKFAKNLSSLLSFNNNIAIVPYSQDRTSSTIMLKFENSTREIKLPNPDYHIHLTIRGFKNILFKEGNIDEQWIYGSYVKIKIFQPDLEKVYFDEKLKNGLNVEFSKRSTKNKDSFEWIFFIDSLKILFDNFSKQTVVIDKKWLKSASKNKKINKSFKELAKIYEKCK
ncbi:hypothetical protein IDG98_01980 [Pelagibacterales bacterium SAG-MED17]|nr:hypothetical protein [Pelagibacterales bacterium SAG-MED17]